MPAYQTERDELLLGRVSGTAVGLLAGWTNFGGGVFIVPVVFYGLVEDGTSADQAAHVAVGCRRHWSPRRRTAAGSTDIRFLRVHLAG
jgi:uncharacterized membrane protein YfcA